MLRHHKVATNLNPQLRPRRKSHEEIERRRQPRPKKIKLKQPQNPKKSKLLQLLLKLCLPNQLQNLPTNLLPLKSIMPKIIKPKRKTPNMLLRSSTKSQSITTPAKKLLPFSTNSSPRSTTSADFKSSSPDKRRRPRSRTKRTNSSKNNSSSVLMKIN